jgi:tRNA modification GTPase
VGKSSLLNCLSGEDVALVSDIPGTTRDVIRHPIQIRGVPLHIMDTAGLRESQDTVENMGIARAQEALKRADLILLVLDATTGMTPDTKIILQGLPATIPRLLVFNKADLLDLKLHVADPESGYISAKTGFGLDLLRIKLLELVGWQVNEGGTFMARTRHLAALNQASLHLAQASTVIDSAELFAEELRLAQSSLSGITGKFTADDLLGEIFSRFCIGK